VYLGSNRRRNRYGPRRSGVKRRIFLALLIVVLVSQVPFAYRRYRLRRLNNSIQQLAAQRVPAANTEYSDYAGVIHVHSALGGHSTGNFAELISAAKTNQLAFVIMTEHPQGDFDTSAMTLNGDHAGVLFVNGNEVATANNDRLLLIPGTSDAASAATQSTQQIIDAQKSRSGLVFAAYPSESQNWHSTTVDGVEVYNLFSNARQIRPVIMFFDGLWSYRSYADLMFANFFVRPDENLKNWDSAITDSNRKLVAIAGNDAHSNVGVSLNDSSGKQIVGLKLDPYERSFRTVRTHILLAKDAALTRESLLEALSRGHCYVSFDLFGDPRGFQFAVNNSSEMMGDEVSAANQPRLRIHAPLPARVILLKNGSVISQRTGTDVEFAPDGAGSYRVELYLDSLPAPATNRPWILSNPIYVR
jgi:hypothetical protein